MTAGSYVKITCPHCGGHLEYPVEATDSVAGCPHCHQAVTLKTGRQGGRRWALWVALLLAGLVIGGGGWFLWSKKSMHLNRVAASALPNPPPADLQRTNQLALWDFVLERKDGSAITHAVAKLLNESDTVRYGIVVRLELTDELGRKVGTCRDYVERLEPNQVAYVHALVVYREAARARLLDVSEH